MRQATQTIEDRVSQLRSRKLLATTAGIPAPPRIIKIHTCYRSGIKPSFCSCAERVTEQVAHELIQLGGAEWVKSARGDSSYTFRREIVLRDIKQDDPTYQTYIRLLPTLVKATDSPVDLQKLLEQHTKHKKATTRASRQKTNTNAAVKSVLAKLTSEELQLADEQEILSAFQTDDGASVLAKKLSSDPNRQAQLVKIITAGMKRFWNAQLSGANLTVHRGETMDEAPKGRGKLVYLSGRTSSEVEQIAAHMAENEDGHHRVKAANFKPGGKIYSSGQDPIRYCGGDADDYEVAQNSYQTGSEKGANPWGSGNPNESDEFELAEKQDEEKDKFEKQNGLTFKQTQRLDKELDDICENSDED